MRLLASIKASLQWILRMQTSDGAFLLSSNDDSSRGVWPTSQAICAILAHDTRYISTMGSSLSWLLTKQIDGFWGPMQEGFQFNDSTAWTILAFSLANSINREHDQIILESISKLVDNHNDDGGWGSWKEDQSRIVTTSLILFLINNIRKIITDQRIHYAHKSAVQFLRNCQNPDGGWGFAPLSDSNVIATSYALVALSKDEDLGAILAKGIEFLEEERRQIDNTHTNVFKYESVWRKEAIQRWSYYSLPLLSFALALNGRGYSAYKVIRKIVSDQNPTGSWTDPDEPYLAFHTYTASFFLSLASKHIDLDQFERYLGTIELINKQEEESVLLAYKSKLKKVILEDSFHYSHEGFKLTSGKTSQFFYDLKPVLLNPITISIIGRILWEMIKDDGIDAIGGPETGAIPIAISVVREALSQGKELKAFYVRKQAKSHGTRRWIEGTLNRNDKVILIEDVVTTGGSLVNAIEKLEEHDCIINRVICLVDREQGGAETLFSRNVTFSSIFKHSDFGSVI